MMGVNDRQQLAAADSIMRRLCREAISKGVTVIDPSTTYASRQSLWAVDNPRTHLRVPP